MYVLINYKLIFPHFLSDEMFDNEMFIKCNENMMHYKEMPNEEDIFHI